MNNKPWPGVTNMTSPLKNNSNPMTFRTMNQPARNKKCFRVSVVARESRIKKSAGILMIKNQAISMLPANIKNEIAAPYIR